MRTNGLIVALALGAIAVSAGCTRSGRVEPPRPEAGPGRAVKSHPICNAIESADAFLAEHRAPWGEPRQVRRTGSNWYRLEYERSDQGAERVVLVSPTDGHAELPMRR